MSTPATTPPVEPGDAGHTHLCCRHHAWQHTGPSAENCPLPILAPDAAVLSEGDCAVCAGRDDLLTRPRHSHHCPFCEVEWIHEGRCVKGLAAWCPWDFPGTARDAVTGTRIGHHLHHCPDCGTHWAHRESCAALWEAALPTCPGCGTPTRESQERELQAPQEEAQRQLRATRDGVDALGHRVAGELRARSFGARVAWLERRAPQPARSLAAWRPGRSWRGRARAWIARAGATALVLVTVLFALQRWPDRPPPNPRSAASPQVTALPRPSAAPVPARVMPAPPAVAGPARGSPEPRKRDPESGDRATAQQQRASGAVSRAPSPAARRPGSLQERALLDAVEAGELMAVRRLLDSGASPSARDPEGVTALMTATIHGHGAVAGLLLDRGADVNARDADGVTALMLAARDGEVALVQRLLDRGAIVDARAQDGWTALTYAARKGHPDIARRLLRAGADPTLTDRSGWSALMYASWRAAESNSGDRSAIADTLHMKDLEAVEVARRRYNELVSLLGGATKRR
jgi:hypothetical protein